MDLISNTLENFLNLYWLRPESAIWRTLDFANIPKNYFKRPFLDAGCGDGSFSFTLFQGKTSSAFDVYTTIKSTKNFFVGKDIHNQIPNSDPIITKKPNMLIDVGLDWKENLLKKAKKYGIYQKLIKHNLNKKFPFESCKFKTVFSNVYYWVDKPEFTLSETKRIITNDGKIIVLLPNSNFKEYLIYNYFLQGGYKWAKILDRGIHENIKHCYSLSTWKSIFSKSGLKIDFHSTHLSNSFIKFWSIGLRPYSPYLIDMANKLNPKDREKIKKRLVKELLPIFRSYIDYELQQSSQKNCFHTFILSKK